MQQHATEVHDTRRARHTYFGSNQLNSIKDANSFSVSLEVQVSSLLSFGPEHYLHGIQC